MMMIALAHTAAARQPFNADFYTVAAGVIPVLFLALTLQSDFWKTLLRVMEDDAELAQAPLTLRGIVRRPVPVRELPARLAAYIKDQAGFVAYCIALLTFPALLVGEILALVALDERSAAGGTWPVLISAIFLTVVAGIAAAVPFATAIRRSFRRARRAKAPQAPTTHQQNAIGPIG